MSLNYKIIGQGKRSIVFIHGWYFNKDVWQPIYNSLSDKWKIILIDLPGHGGSPVFNYSLESLAKILVTQIKQPALWVGWSLGGLIALRIAQMYQDQCMGLLLINSSPCFVKKENWIQAIDESVFNNFSQQLDTQPTKVLKRFLRLQLADIKNHQQTKQMTPYLSPPPPTGALQNGLQLLQKTDLREDLHTLSCPVQWIFAEDDKIVPIEVADQMVQIMPKAHYDTLNGAGHMPFTTHTIQLTHFLNKFLTQCYA